MKKFVLLIFVIGLNVSPAWAGLADAPVIRSTEIDDRHLRAFAETEGRPTLADYYESNRPLKSNQDQLHRLIERAQSLWLNGSTESARSVFKEISQLSLNDDWRGAQRESIHYADLRLAQSALTPDESTQWLEKAVRDFPELKPSLKVFPPPLIASFNDVKAHLRTQFSEVELGDRFRDYRFMLINGQKYDLEDTSKISLPPGTFRVTLLSNLHSRITETMTASQLRIFQFVVPPIARGSCQDPHLADGPELDFPVSVVYKENCYRTHNRAGWLNPSPELSDLQLKGIEIPSTSSQLAPANPMASFEITKPEEPFITKRSLIIVGATVIAAGIVYAIVAHQRHTETEATHANGY